MERSPGSRIFNPKPRRPANLSLTPVSSSTSDGTSPNDQSPSDFPSAPATPSAVVDISSQAPASNNSTRPDAVDPHESMGDLQSQQNSRSILNLTSSTLLGIYAPSTYEANRDEPLTPFGTGTQTPARSTSVDMRSGSTPSFTAQAFREKAAIGKERRSERRKSMQQQRQRWRRKTASSRLLSILMRTSILFTFGLAYGEAITTLHNSGRVAPVQVHRIDRSSGIYLASWGIAGILLGVALPFLDRTWGHVRVRELGEHGAHGDETAFEQDFAVTDEDDATIMDEGRSGRLAADWSDLVRSIGAFVGIAFAIVSQNDVS